MMIGRWVGVIAAALLLAASPARAEEAYLRVVDVGAGLCVVAVAPGGHAMVYDTGAGTKLCLEAVEMLIPGPTIDLLVLSH